MEDNSTFNDSEEKKTYTVTEVQPQFPNGEAAMMAFIKENLVFPYEAQKAEIEGTVLVEFLVNPDGSLTNIRILEGKGYGCDEEVIRVVRMMPNWSPQLINGVAVYSKVRIPVKFKLEAPATMKIQDIFFLILYSLMATAYIGIGTFFMFSDLAQQILEAPLNFGFGIMIMIYGFFRAYRTYHWYKGL